MYSKEEAREQIKKLAEDFESKLDYSKNSGQYKEAQIEDEFIKPLFKYLNWNISNEGISNTADREFIVQAKGRDARPCVSTILHRFQWRHSPNVQNQTRHSPLLHLRR